MGFCFVLCQVLAGSIARCALWKALDCCTVQTGSEEKTGLSEVDHGGGCGCESLGSL